MLFAVLSLLAVVQPARPFDEERLLLDRRLETLRRILPDGPNPVADVAVVRELAEGAKLGRVALAARPPVETGSRGDVPIDIAAYGRFADIDRFFRQIALSPRLIDVESLTLSATTEEVIKLSAVVRLPFRPAKAPLPTPPEGKSRPTGVPRPTLDAFDRDQALALAKSDTIARCAAPAATRGSSCRSSRPSARDRPVVLNFASLGDEFLVRGQAVGEGPMRALEQPLRARLLPRLRVPDGAAGRVPPFRGAGPEPGRRDRRRAASARRKTRSSRTTRRAAWTAIGARGAGQGPEPARPPARARSPCGCATWTLPTSSGAAPPDRAGFPRGR